MKNFLLSLSVLLALNAYAQCDVIHFQVVSDLNGGGPPAIEWELEDQVNDVAISAGDYVFGNQADTLEWDECLVQGCYRLRIEADDDMSEGDITIIITDSQGNLVLPFEPLEWNDDRIDYVFGVAGGCSGVADCMAGFTWSEGSDAGEIILQNNSLFETTAQYGWSWNNGESSQEESPVILFSENGIYEVCLTLLAECVNTVCQQVVVDNYPIVECPDSLGIAEVECGIWILSTGAPSGTNVSWNFGDGSTDEDGGSISHEFPGAGVYTVCATFTTEECGELTLCDTIDILECGNNTGCPGEIESELIDCGEFEFSIENVVSGNATWNFGDNTDLAQDLATEHIYITPGEYIACVFYTSEVCESGIELCIPVIVDDCNGDECEIELEFESEDGQTFSFEAISSSAIGNFTWDFGDGGNGEGSAAETHTYALNGSYLVCVSSPATIDCPDGFSVCTTIIVTGGANTVTELSGNAFLLYPNPAANEVNIISNERILSIALYDLTGRSIASVNNTNRMDISSFGHGYYVVTVTTISGTSRKVLIKE